MKMSFIIGSLDGKFGEIFGAGVFFLADSSMMCGKQIQLLVPLKFDKRLKIVHVQVCGFPSRGRCAASKVLYHDLDCFFVGLFVLKGQYVVLANQINSYILNIIEVLLQTQISITE